MTDAPNKKFDVVITVTLPGYQKPTVVRLSVEAPSLSEGVEAAQAAWYNATKAKDLAIREV